MSKPLLLADAENGNGVLRLVPEKEKAEESEPVEKAVFDFSRLYYLHQQAYGLAYRNAYAPNATFEAVDEWMKQQAFVVHKALVSVPSYLLRPDTPKDVDWHDEESSQWWLYGALDILHAQFVDAYNERQKKLIGR